MRVNIESLEEELVEIIDFEDQIDEIEDDEELEGYHRQKDDQFYIKVYSKGKQSKIQIF